MTNGTVQVNGRTYAWPREPIVGVCIDGSQPAHDDEPGYIEEAVRAGVALRWPRLFGQPGGLAKVYSG